ncbi:MAG: sigma-54-dependent Fis family transcriptional regulator [Bacteroidetes bacterium]|nr:MAG: sigma-54-dependent Fis family transcriptional regulator [Bacteroidota bacterium]
MNKRSVFIVEDDPTLRRLLERVVTENWGFEAQTFPDGISCLENLHEPPDIVLLDIMMPGKSGVEVLAEIKLSFPELPVIMISAQENVGVALETLKRGATDYICKPIDMPRLEASIKNAIQTYDLSREVSRLRQTIEKTMHFDNIVSGDGKMQNVFKFVNKVKDTTVSVLIQGESGTGKELIARAIHFNGNRKDKPFVVVNCASIPKDLLESELFGHERGAFTGAVNRKIGKFELADNGTIFLDEIGELDMSLQAKLLRVLQAKEFERVGGTNVLKSDVRVISATNKDLHRAVLEKEFREDLYFRLATFPIFLPALRERRSDILLLAEHFLKRAAQEHGKNQSTFSRSALKLLYDYSWPGNVREMEHAIERAVILADQDVITEKELPMAIQALAQGEYSPSETTHLFGDGNTIIPFEKIKEEALRHALRVTDGNLVEAAKRLNLGRATLYRLVKRYEIEI